MRRRGAGLGLTTVLAMVLASVVCAQQDVQELQRRLLELEKKLQEQQVAFDQKVADLQKQIDEKSGEEEAALSDRINAVQKSVEKLDRLYRRPSIGQSTPSESIFSALQGGLIFTGLFRTRFEARRDNVDFNDTADGLDDSGLRLNGRFRLGFGAVLLERSPGGPQITALTEFQSVGTFANNSYVRLTSSTGVPVPLQFNILTEPFEAVGLYQGYLALSKVIDDTINVKVGRQEVVLGNELMLGNNSFEDGTVHDSLLFQWQPLEELVFTTLYSKEAASDGGLGNTRSDFDEDEMAVLYAEIKPDPSMSFDLYGIYFDARSAVNDIFVTGSTAFAFDGSYTPPILGHTWTVGGRAFFTHFRTSSSKTS